MAKLNFLKDYVSHNPSEIILMLIWCSSNIFFFIFINIQKSCAASFFCGNHNTFFSGLHACLNQTSYFPVLSNRNTLFKAF